MNWENLRSRLFASPLGRITMVGLLVVGLGGAAYGLKKNYDPGPNTAAHPRGEPLGGYESHASFEKECLHCHVPVHCLSANRCQTCHIEQAKERADATGLHGLLPGTNDCQNCHTEHKGRDAIITEMPFENIDHEGLTGFSLRRHESDFAGDAMICDDCHTERRFSREKVDCSTCHLAEQPDFMDSHLASFGSSCLDCHDGRDRMRDFDHNTVFVLENAHAALDCEACHANYDYADVSGECVDCHAEPEIHASLFGVDCARCHTTVDWLNAELKEHRFDLAHGGEQPVDCATCHPDTYVTHDCYGCHEAHQPVEMRTVHEPEGVVEIAECVTCHPTGAAGEGGDYLDEH